MRRALALHALATTYALDWVNPKYWQLQASTAKLVGAAIGRGSTVLEVDAVDGAKKSVSACPKSTCSATYD